jgi:hypothetical protein
MTLTRILAALLLVIVSSGCSDKPSIDDIEWKECKTQIGSANDLSLKNVPHIQLLVGCGGYHPQVVSCVFRKDAASVYGPKTFDPDAQHCSLVTTPDAWEE